MNQLNDDRCPTTLDPQSKICAEMYRNETGLYSFVCFYCGHICESFGAIDTHISDSHFVDEPPLHHNNEEETKDDEVVSIENSSSPCIILSDEEEEEEKCKNNSDTDDADEAHHQEIYVSEKRNSVPKSNTLPKNQKRIPKQQTTTPITHQTAAGENSQYSQYKCHICFQTHSSTESLNDHIRTHTSGEKSYICKICGHCFLRPYSLKIHMRIHGEQEQPAEQQEENSTYKCDICLRVLSTKLSLKMHLEIHTKKNRFKCIFCGKVFKRLDSFKSHVQIHTGEKQTHNCNMCSKSLTSRRRLKLHRIRIHKVK